MCSVFIYIGLYVNLPHFLCGLFCAVCTPLLCHFGSTHYWSDKMLSCIYTRSGQSIYNTHLVESHVNSQLTSSGSMFRHGCWFANGVGRFGDRDNF